MKKVVLLLILTFSFSGIYAQEDKSTLFIKQVLPNRIQVFRQEKGIVGQDIVDRYFAAGKGASKVGKGKRPFEHIIQFTEKEKQYIRSEFLKMENESWSGNLYPDAKILTKDSLDKVSSKTDGDWQNFKKNVSTVYTFSRPIFLRHDKFVLFYVGYYCGNLCGEGSLAIYQQKDDYWIPTAIIYSWIS
ncbi:hypothetical protein [Mucilaginibacter sp.]|uniref:hypothetical protein n=1 Tax=Mucilaginibacter sp. TaxID=1882438 RepID=UPI0035BBDF06